MAEYIEREAVEKMLDDAGIVSDGEYNGYCTEDVNIKDIPAADVLPVVRCKECVYFELDKEKAEVKKWCHMCRNFGIGVTQMDFCSYGERMDEEDEHEAD